VVPDVLKGHGFFLGGGGGAALPWRWRHWSFEIWGTTNV